MKRILHTWSRLASDDEGGALVLVLTLVVVAVTLVGIVLAAQVAQFRFVRRDVHRLQARYEAEAGVYAAIDSLQINPLWRARDATFQLPRGLAPVVSAEAFGGFIYVRAIGRSRRVTSTLRALVAAHPEGAHAQALVVWDLNSDVTLAGTTTVTGDVVVGDRGVRTSSFKGHRFTGSVTGTVLPAPELPPPYFSDSLFQETISWAESLLSQVHAAEATASREPLPLPSTGSTQFFPADVVITSADSTLLAGTDVVVSGGSIFIQGPLEYAPASTFIAAVRLELRGEVDRKSVV